MTEFIAVKMKKLLFTRPYCSGIKLLPAVDFRWQASAFLFFGYQLRKQDYHKNLYFPYASEN
jgi:hypothetical protein